MYVPCWQGSNTPFQSARSCHPWEYQRRIWGMQVPRANCLVICGACFGSQLGVLVLGANWYHVQLVLFYHTPKNIAFPLNTNASSLLYYLQCQLLWHYCNWLVFLGEGGPILWGSSKTSCNLCSWRKGCQVWLLRLTRQWNGGWCMR